MCVRFFSGQDGSYGLESEEVILTPEDENPLRRILQVHALHFSLAISTIYLSPLSLSAHQATRMHAHTEMHTNKTEHTHSATLSDLGCGTITGLTLTRGKTSSPPTHMRHSDGKFRCIGWFMQAPLHLFHVSQPLTVCSPKLLHSVLYSSFSQCFTLRK